MERRIDFSMVKFMTPIERQINLAMVKLMVPIERIKDNKLYYSHIFYSFCWYPMTGLNYSGKEHFTFFYFPLYTFG